MAEASEDILEAVALIIIVMLALFAIAVAIVPKGFTGTSAGAFAAANALAYSLSGLSLADQGSITRDLNGTYDIEIALESGSGGSLKNYYLIVTPYTESGTKMNPTEKIYFTGNVKVGDKPVKIEKAKYAIMTKSYGNPVEVSSITQTVFTVTFCPEATTPEQIEEYIIKYTTDDERKWVKAIIFAESEFVPCARNGDSVGLMMLRTNAAIDTGVGNRGNPEQNVMGGTKYYRNAVTSYGRYDDRNVLALAAYNCGIGRVKKLVMDNCESKGIFSGCWDKAIKGLTEKQYCQSADGKSAETYNYVSLVQRCVEYYGQHPDCFNSPGKGSECPSSSTCKHG
jgi:hypothetical protein